MKRNYFILICSMLCLILCLGLVSCGGNGGTENGGTEGNKNYVTITFDKKDGSVLESVQVEKGGKIPKPQDPTKEGYTLNGWCYSGEKWSFIGYVATEDMTLEASWTPITYTIEYNGQVNHTNKTTYTVEDDFDLVGSAEGVYIFQGWYLDEEFTKPISKIEKGTTGNLKLYGKTKDSGLKVELKENEYAVVGCDENVTSVVIPETCNGLRITSIGDGAFSDCTGLTNVEIPNSVTTVGSSAFLGCTGLTSIIVDEGNPSYKSIDGNLYSKDEKAFILYAPGKKDTTFVIPSYVTSIGDYAFEGCTGLTSVTIPNSVTTIGDFAFSGCTGLTSVEIPNRVTEIGNYAFSNCTGLTSVVISNSVTTGYYAFYGCTSLTSVTIGDDVTSIDLSVFSGCTGLTSIIVDEGNPSYKSIDGNLYSKDEKAFILYAPGKKDTSFVVPNGVTTIGDYAFEDCTELTSVTIGDDVTTIGSSAFEGCTGLTSVTIGNSVIKIGYGAFRGCTGLTSVTIPNSVTTIGNHAFSGCKGLTSVTIPRSVILIDSGAFCSCTGLTSIIVNEGNSSYKSIGGNLYSKDEKTLVQYAIGKKDTSFVIPNGVTSIGDYAFMDCTGLTSVVIPNSVTSIGNNAFSHCTGLTSVKIPNNVISIGNYAFMDCTGLKSIVIPNSVTTIGWNAFNVCESLTIYCEAGSKPDGWYFSWNPLNRPVVWGYKEN